MRTATIIKFNRVTRLTEDKETGVFHGWSTDYEECDNGVGTYSVAIIELPDGRIELPRADRIRFNEPTLLP